MTIDPAFFKVAITLIAIAGSFIFNALYISWKVGKTIGQYESTVKSMQEIFIERSAKQDKAMDDLRDRVEEFIGQIAYLEGKINGRRA